MRGPLEQAIANKGKGEFKFDPENGGGRRKRIKKISRIEMLQAEEANQQANNRLNGDFDEDFDDDNDMMNSCVNLDEMLRPLGVCETLY